MIDVFIKLMDSLGDRRGTLEIVCCFLVVIASYFYMRYKQLEQSLDKERAQRYQDLKDFHEEAQNMEKDLWRYFEEKESKTHRAIRDTFERGMLQGRVERDSGAQVSGKKGGR